MEIEKQTNRVHTGGGEKNSHLERVRFDDLRAGARACRR